MAKDFYIPKLGQTVEEVTIVKWLVEDGARVDFGDEILEVETDKAVFPVEANAKGYLHIGPYNEGDVVPILVVVATIGKKDETFAPGGVEAEGEPAPDEAAPAAEAVAETVAVPEAPPAPPETEGGRIFASPRARKIAAEKGLDLRQVTPTGGDGVRIVERDVLAYLETIPKATPVAQKMAVELGVDLRTITGSGEQGKITKEDVLQTASLEKVPEPAVAPTPAPVPAPVSISAPPSPPIPAENILERVPLTGIRGIVSRRMAESIHTTARVTLVTEVDATEFVALRERLKARFTDEWGFAPGYNDLLGLIVADALCEFPYMNARLAPEGDAVEYLKPINLGLAVDTERGLLVVVIRDANTKGLQQFGSEFREMVNRARVGKSKPDDLTGGTFTITNLGMHRVDAFTPAINLPEAAILGVGRIKPRPVVKDDQVVIRKMLTLSLVFDHRLTDGAPAARFLDYICELIEEPSLLFLIRR